MMSKQINLEAYRGQGEDAQKWFTYFERWSTFMNYNEERAALALPFHLKRLIESNHSTVVGLVKNSSYKLVQTHTNGGYFAFDNYTKTR